MIEAGTRLPPLETRLTRLDLVRYAGASGDFNPIHWSESAAATARLPTVIAHGMLTMGVALRAVTEWCGDPGLVVDYGVRFSRVVPVPDGEGALIRVDGAVAHVDDDGTAHVELSVTHAGDEVLTRAYAVVRPPRDGRLEP